MSGRVDRNFNIANYIILHQTCSWGRCVTWTVYTFHV